MYMLQFPHRRIANWLKMMLKEAGINTSILVTVLRGVGRILSWDAYRFYKTRCEEDSAKHRGKTDSMRKSKSRG